MQTKKFLLQIQFDEQTRWPYREGLFLEQLRECALAAVRVSTEGRVPLVTITKEEQPQNHPGAF